LNTSPREAFTAATMWRMNIPSVETMNRMIASGMSTTVNSEIHATMLTSHMPRLKLNAPAAHARTNGLRSL